MPEPSLNGHAERNGTHKPPRRHPSPGLTQTLSLIARHFGMLLEADLPGEPLVVRFHRGSCAVEFTFAVEEIHAMVDHLVQEEQERKTP